MSDAERYARVLNGFGPTGGWSTAALGLALATAGVALLLTGWARRTGQAAVAAGLVLVLAALWVLHEQTVITKPIPGVTAIRPRYSERTLGRIELALAALPAAALGAACWATVEVRRWRRTTVPKHILEGVRLFQTQHYDDALAAFDLAVAIAPNRGEAYWRRGCVHEAMGDVDRALADFNRAIRYDPRLHGPYLRRGRLRTERKDYQDALADFDRALVVRPNDPEAHLHRGVCLFERGDLAAASTEFQRVLRLSNHADQAVPAQTYLARIAAGNGAAAEAVPGPTLTA
jgi:tetratricopeptide (TPR) repeat protein